MEKANRLIDVAKRIIDFNSGCMISGSLSLFLQGIKIRSTPGDIDIYLPFNQKLNKVDGMKVSVNDSDDYPEDNWNRESFILNDIHIDVFTPSHKDVLPLISGNEDYLVSVADILSFKMSHALGDHWTNKKHKFDLIHILVNS